MKKLLLSIVVTSLLWSCTPIDKTQNYNIQGRVMVEELEGKWVFLVPSFQNMSTTLDSTKIVNGKFELSGKAPFSPSVALMVVTDENKVPVVPRVASNLVLEPGLIDAVMDKNYQTIISGTTQNDMVKTCRNAIAMYYDTCELITTLSLSNEEKYDLMVRTQQNRNATMLKAILPHVNSEAVQYIMQENYFFFTKDELELVKLKLEPERENVVESSIKIAESMAVGQTINEVEMPDMNGDMVSLMGIVKERNYTLLDFWASWCGPCIRAIPEIQVRYQQHSRSCFGVVGISLDKNRGSWIASINKHDIEWTNLSNLVGWDCPVAKMFGVNFVPSTILLDRYGVVICRNPSSAELDIYLNRF